MKTFNLGNTRYMQYVAAITGTLAVACSALYVTWPSPILPKIAAGDSPLGNITQEECSWIVSSLLLGFVPGSIISGWVLDHFGRRGCLLLSGVPMLLAWFPIAFVSSVWVMCFARFVAGVAIAITMSGAMVYIGEIAEKEIRGRLGSTVNILGLIGEVITFCIGPYISYVALTLTSSAVSLMFLVLFYFMPESPYYLIKIGKEDKAKTSLKKLLSNNISAAAFEEQLHIIKNTINEEMKNKSTLIELISKREYRKSLVVSFGLHSLNQLSGFAALMAYMQTILEYSNGSIPAELSSVFCGLVQLPTVFVAAALVDKVGRRPLLIISLLGCALALNAIGIFFYLQDVLHADVANLQWIPTTGILLYVVIRPIGIGTLIYVLMGELFTTNIKGHAIAISTFYKSVLSFVVAKSFAPITKAWGLHVIFWFYTLVCIVGAAFVYCSVPETKGKTFAEIREDLNKNSKVHSEQSSQL